MRSVNKVILVGNLTRDPELKSTASGQSIVTFGIATNRQWVTSGAERKSSAEFHECVAWAKLAEICQSYLRKGMLVYVEGYLKTRSWDLEDGTRRFRTEVVLQDMIMLEKRAAGAEGDYLPTEELANSSNGDMGMMADSGQESHSEMASTPASSAPAQAAEASPDSSTTASSGGLTANLDDENMF